TVKVAASGDKEALLSGDAAVTVGLLPVVTAVERFEAHQAEALERLAEPLEGLLDTGGIDGMGQDGDPPDLPDQLDRLVRRREQTRSRGRTVVGQVTVKCPGQGPDAA